MTTDKLIALALEALCGALVELEWADAELGEESPATVAVRDAIAAIEAAANS